MYAPKDARLHCRGVISSCVNSAQ